MGNRSETSDQQIEERLTTEVDAFIIWPPLRQNLVRRLMRASNEGCVYADLLRALWEQEPRTGKLAKAQMDSIYHLVSEVNKRLPSHLKVLPIRGKGYWLKDERQKLNANHPRTSAVPPLDVHAASGSASITGPISQSAPWGSSGWKDPIALLGTTWPVPGAAAREYLELANGIATQKRSYHLGLEHLALALLQVPTSGIVAQVQLQVRQNLNGLKEQLPELDAQASYPNPDFCATPFLIGLGQHLTPEFSIEDIWRNIGRIREQCLRWIGDGIGKLMFDELPTGALKQGGASAPLQRPATGFRVLGGPEDGRELYPAAGQVIGRWILEPTADLCLYEKTGHVDGSLSRRHLKWLGEGTVEALEPITSWIRFGETLKIPKSSFQALSDDRLKLTPATHLYCV